MLQFYIKDVRVFFRLIRWLCQRLNVVLAWNNKIFIEQQQECIFLSAVWRTYFDLLDIKQNVLAVGWLRPDSHVLTPQPSPPLSLSDEGGRERVSIYLEQKYGKLNPFCTGERSEFIQAFYFFKRLKIRSPWSCKNFETFHMVDRCTDARFE